MCRWLGYGSQHEENASSRLLPHREFSFTTGDDVYIRYLSYEDAAGLKKVCARRHTPSPAQGPLRGRDRVRTQRVAEADPASAFRTW